MKAEKVVCGGCGKKTAHLQDGQPVYPLTEGKPGCAVCHFQTKQSPPRLCPLASPGSSGRSSTVAGD